MARRLSMLVIAAGLLAGGCDPPNLTPTSEVVRLRVLAIEAEPAELQFGDVVTLRPTIADPWSEGYAVQWMPCVEASIGGFAACDFDNMLVDLSNPLSLGALAQEELSFTVDQQAVYDLLAERDPLDRADGVGLQFILMLLPRGKSFFDYMPEFDVTEIDDPDYLAAYEQEAAAAMGEVFEALIRQSRISYKRVIVSDPGSVGIALHDEGECVDLPGLRPNEGPQLGGLIERVEGQDTAWPTGATLEVPMGQSVELRPLWNPDGREPYYHVAWSGETECRVENPYFGWYATAGGFDDPDGFSIDYSYLDEFGEPAPVLWQSPRSEPEHNPVQGWLVVWDRRGGMSSVRFQFELVEGADGPEGD
jgi:hypothetical protein